MIEIQRMVEGDLEALAQLYRQFWNEESNLDKMRGTFLRLSGDPDYIFLAAKSHGQLVGSAMGIVCEELYAQCQPFMVVEDVVVDREHRRQGVGTKLMQMLERRAIERVCSYIIFVTESQRSDACGFYHSLGYDPDKHKGFKKRLGDGQHSLPADAS